MIWTELCMGGGVIVCKRGHKERRKLRKEIKKLRWLITETELAVELDIRLVSPYPSFLDLTSFLIPHRYLQLLTEHFHLKSEGCSYSACPNSVYHLPLKPGSFPYNPSHSAGIPFSCFLSF